MNYCKILLELFRSLITIIFVRKTYRHEYPHKLFFVFIKLKSSPVYAGKVVHSTDLLA